MPKSRASSKNDSKVGIPPQIGHLMSRGVDQALMAREPQGGATLHTAGFARTAAEHQPTPPHARLETHRCGPDAPVFVCSAVRLC